MAPQLFPDQSEGVEQIAAAFRRGHRSVCFQLATGGGKTHVFTYIASRYVNAGLRVGVLVHRHELLEQAIDRLALFDIPAGRIQAGRGIDLTYPCQVASVQTIARRLHQLPPDLFDLLVVDECHHSCAGQWARVLGHFQARVLGVTATPNRPDGQGLRQHYSELIEGPSPQWLTDHQRIAPARLFAPPPPPVPRRRGHDYDMKQGSEIMRAGSIMGDSLSLYRQHLDGQTAVAFCCDVAHAEAVAEMFRNNGVPAAAVDGTMRRDPRAIPRILEDLGNGTLKVVTSCQLIGEGTDIPSVGGALLLAQTRSVVKHLQEIGRPLRYQPGKTAIICDQVGNIRRLGCHLWDEMGQERQWSLDGATKRSKGDAPSVKVCPECFSANRSGSPRCSNCGYEFVLWRRGRELKHVEGELQEVSRPGPSLPERRAAARTLEELEALGREQGMTHPLGWARHVLAWRAHRAARRRA